MTDFVSDNGDDLEDVREVKLIEKILSQMHSEFNKTTVNCLTKNDSVKTESETELSRTEEIKAKDEEDGEENKEQSEEMVEDEEEGEDEIEEKTFDRVVEEGQKQDPSQEISTNTADSGEETKDDRKDRAQTPKLSKMVEEKLEHPRIILKLKTQDDENHMARKRSPKLGNKENKNKRGSSSFDGPVEKRRKSRLTRSNVISLKRSSRRMSKDFSRGESVLQNAIARKEKSLISFSQDDKPRRSTRLNEESNKLVPNVKSSPRHKIFTRSHVSTDGDVNNSNGESSQNSPLRQQGRSSEHEDTSSDVSSLSCRRSTRNNIKSPKENLSIDESSVNAWPSLNGKPAGEETELFDLKEKNTPKVAAGLLCECEDITSMFSKLGYNQHCHALDTFDEKIVKCANFVDELPLLRSYKTVPYQHLCRNHFERMLRHNICAVCGCFCTQGIVNICVNNHFFHKECEWKHDEDHICPHCGSTDFSEHRIQIKSFRYPLFLPLSKSIAKKPLARMSFLGGRSNKTSNDSHNEMETLQKALDEYLPPVSITLGNGRVITSKGIPLCEQVKLTNLKSSISVGVIEGRLTSRLLYQAAKNGDSEKVLMMMGMGMSPNQITMNPLHAAVKGGHLLVVHLLAQSGADLEVLDKHQHTPLMSACLYKHNKIVKYLVKAGALVTFKGADGMTALHISAKEGNLEASHYLLSCTNTPPGFIDTVDDGRWTALVWAAENSHTKVVRYLLERRADPHIRDSEMNIALHWSAFAGSMEITEDLLNRGSNINLSNTHGDTPLHIAARQGADCCVVILLARGARVDAMNKAGQLPRDCVLDQESYCFTAIDLNMTIRKTITPASDQVRLLSNDVSLGREDNPIQCVNGIDDDGLPTDYTYVLQNCVTSNISIDRRISVLTFCKCEDGCIAGSCVCIDISKRGWYDNLGRLIPEFNFEDPPMLFECNQACSCNVLTCKNRVVQKGLKSKLQLCRTQGKDWGVISLLGIPKGTYVCEYVGEIISDSEADTRKDDSYLFDLDNSAHVPNSSLAKKHFEGDTYCLDARNYGNICRFINHSCRPNLSPVKIFHEHQDLNFPRIAMFANRDIAPNEELGFDYGDKFWIIKCKSFTCCCGEECCRYSESTINQTLEKYQEKLKDETDSLV